MTAPLSTRKPAARLALFAFAVAAALAAGACAPPESEDMGSGDGEAVIASARLALNTTLYPDARCGADQRHTVRVRFRTFALVTDQGPTVLLKWRIRNPDGTTRLAYTRPPVPASGTDYWVRTSDVGQDLDQVEVYVQNDWNSSAWFSADIDMDECE